MTIFDGKKLSSEILDSIKSEVSRWKKKPFMAVVSIGDGSSAYISQKKKASEFLGFGFKHFNFKPSVSSAKFREELNRISKSKKNTSVIVQLPLPEKINNSVLNAIPPEKDPDLLSDKAVGSFFNGRAIIEPPTPLAIIKILEESGIIFENKNIAVFGYGKLVGRFLVPMLLRKGAFVSVIEKDMDKKDVLEISAKADIIISATGVPNSITADMVKTGAVVVDSGFSIVDGKVVGDVDFEAVKNKVSLITPVPGGVGPMGVAMLCQNVAHLFKVFVRERSER
jgi:methylenetetrahydrofolate dehydrogenase (NADP+)/methenyltetrahydrofolate cyclohydrolase